MKKLIVVSHPNIKNSVINKGWMEELKKYPDQFTVHHIDEVYPDRKINVEQEQRLLEEHDVIVLQYPLYWFNSPSFLKQWLDDVLTYGWAYGSTGDKLKGKSIALAISTGSIEEEYQENGKKRVTMEQLLYPFKTTILFTGSIYSGSFILHGVNSLSKEEIQNSTQQYIQFVQQIPIASKDILNSI